MKTIISLIALLLFAFNLRAEDVKVTLRTEKELKITITSEKKCDYLLIMRESKKSLPKLADSIKYLPEAERIVAGSKVLVYDGFEVEYLGKAKADISITDMKPNNSYILDLYTFDKEKEKYIYNHVFSTDTIVTLALEPTETTSKVMFTKITDTSMMVIFKKGNGENRIVLMKKGRNPKVPADGTVIQKGLGGKKWQLLADSTFVIYNSFGTRSSQMDLEGLERGTNYYFYVLEYNGDGKSTNFYNRNGIMNPKDQSTLILPPVLNPIEEVSAKGFKLSWQTVPDALAYMYEVATDPDFKDILEDYDQHDVGTLTEEYVDISGYDAKEYYVRLRVYMKTTKSNWTETIKVKTR